MVKNLENVQGDERDVILFLAHLRAGRGGQVSHELRAHEQARRRAPPQRGRDPRAQRTPGLRLTPDLIDLRRTRAQGVADLKLFLEFAERGPVALAAEARGHGDHESPFERAVADALAARGWTVQPQVGISGYSIDLGIFHPDAPGRFLAGVECDGATYQSSATARDRDKLRQSVLEGLGWSIVRTWSTDWYFDPVREAEKLDARLPGPWSRIARGTRRSSAQSKQRSRQKPQKPSNTRPGDGGSATLRANGSCSRTAGWSGRRAPATSMHRSSASADLGAPAAHLQNRARFARNLNRRSVLIDVACAHISEVRIYSQAKPSWESAS